MLSQDLGSWEASWFWGLPLMAGTVVMHVIGLGLVRSTLGTAFDGRRADRPASLLRFAWIMGGTATLITGLHILQAAVWALAYLALGALSGLREAMLYSVSAITGYGHAQLYLDTHWQMLGALQAMNGVVLFSLSAAFMFGLISRAWPVRET